MCVATKVTANEGESFDSLLKRFTKKVQQAGVVSEARRRQRYQKPVTRRARKAIARRRQAAKAARAARRR